MSIKLTANNFISAIKYIPTLPQYQKLTDAANLPPGLSSQPVKTGCYRVPGSPVRSRSGTPRPRGFCTGW